MASRAPFFQPRRLGWQVSLDAIEDPVWVMGTDRRIVRCNQATTSFIGEGSEEFVGSLCFEMVHGTCTPLPDCPLTRMIKSGRRETGEFFESERWWQVTVDPILDGAGSIRGASHIMVDITEKKQWQEELRRSQVIVATSTDMIALLDREYTYLSANPAYLKAQGMTHDQVIGSTVADVFGEKFFQKVIRPHADRCLAGAEVHYQDWFEFPDSEKVFLDVGYFPHVDDRGEVTGFVVNARDVTELETARQELDQINSQLEELVVERTAQLSAANEDLEAFAHSVSHDLKAPLRAIDGYASMLEGDPNQPLSTEGQRLLGEVRGNAQRMARLIDGLLGLSRVGRASLVIAEVDMEALAQATFAELSEPEKDRTIHFSLHALPTVQGDAALLRQLWVNVLENAIKFTRGKDTARIEVDCLDEPNHWLFRVRDNGVGFCRDYADKPFGVFERLHDSDEFPGTGVGLATVQRIIDRHEGEVWIEGEVEEGATVFFRLPYRLKVT